MSAQFAVAAASLPPLPRNPVLYQIRASVLLEQLSSSLHDTIQHACTLADVPLSWFNDLRFNSVDAIYLLGVWQTGAAGLEYSVGRAGAGNAISSPFAISEWAIHAEVGGEDALKLFKYKANACGMRVVIDFVPNHTGVDHVWTRSSPSLYVCGTPADAARQPDRYFQVTADDGSTVYIHHGMHVMGDGPDVCVWGDTAQLDWGSAATHSRMNDVLMSIATAGTCDGVRVDMGALTHASVWTRTWSESHPPSDFWGRVISSIRALVPAFMLVCECYGDTQHALMRSSGFEYVYDGETCAALTSTHAATPARVLTRMCVSQEVQRHMVRYCENHDEQRVARLKAPAALCAALVALTLPGLRFIHDGQITGRTVHHSVHARVRTPEHAHVETLAWYTRMLPLLKSSTLRNGGMHVAHVTPSKDGNDSHKSLLAWFLTPSRAATCDACAAVGSSASYSHTHTQTSVSASSLSSACASESTHADGSPVAPMMKSLPVSLAAATSPAPTTMSTPQSHASTHGGIAPRPSSHTCVDASPTGVYMCVANVSDCTVDGHVLFTAAHPLSATDPHAIDSVRALTDVIARACGMTVGGARVREPLVGVAGAPLRADHSHDAVYAYTSTGSSAYLDAAAAAQMCVSAADAFGRRAIFLDALDGRTHDYPLDAILMEGWWLQLQPWEHRMMAVTFAHTR